MLGSGRYSPLWQLSPGLSSVVVVVGVVVLVVVVVVVEAAGGLGDAIVEGGSSVDVVVLVDGCQLGQVVVLGVVGARSPTNLLTAASVLLNRFVNRNNPISGRLDIAGGALTDLVIDRAIAARARVAVLPCCHVFKANDQGALSGWVDAALAIDIMRVVKLEQHGYHVRTQTIPAAITPKFPQPTGDDEAVLLYTSGTSGLPKGVILTYGNFQSDVDGSIPVAVDGREQGGRLGRGLGEVLAPGPGAVVVPRLFRFASE